MRRGGHMELQIPVQNPLGFPATIHNVHSSCSCTVAKNVAGDTLAPGEALSLPLSLNLANKSGKFHQSVHLGLAPPVGDVTIKLRGVVVEEYPAEIHVENLRAGESTRERFLLRTWPGQPPLRVEKAVSDVPGIDLAIEEVDANTVAVELVITAGARGEQLEGQVSLHTNDSEVPLKALRVHASVLDSLEPSVEKLVFGAVKPGAAQTLTMTVSTPYTTDTPVFRLEQKNDDRFAITLTPSPGKCVLEATVRAKDSDRGILRDTIVLISADGTSLVIPAFALVQ